MMYLLRINTRSVATIDAIKQIFGAGRSEKVTFRGFYWTQLFSRVGLTYCFRGLDAIRIVASGVRTQFPELNEIWVDGEYAGHVLVFSPSLARISFLAGQNVREMSYSIKPAFRNRGFGTLLVAFAVQACQKDQADIIGLVRPSNLSSLRVFEKFRAELILVRRRHRFHLASYALSASAEWYPNLELDKFEERNRYDLAACTFNMPKTAEMIDESGFGALALSLPLRTPYSYYDAKLSELITEGATVLELGAGTGNNSLMPLRAGGTLTALDISGESLKVLVRRFAKLGFAVQALIGDIEYLPFQSGSFDFVISAGSLSYGGNEMVMGEIIRVLKPGGMFVCVDSLNNNPIYRANRFIHYLRGRRSKGTIVNMPSIRLIESYRAHFAIVETEFFGAISFLAGILVKFCGESRTQKFSDWVDRLIGVRRSAFKFVMIAKKRSDDGTKH